MPATTNDHVYGAAGRVDDRGVVGLRGRREQRAAGQDSAHGEGPFEMVLVTGEHQVDAVLVEQRHEFLADAEVRSVEVGGGHRDLVHEHHDPVDVVVVPRRRQRPFEPDPLLALAVAADVGVEAGARVGRHVVAAVTAETAVLKAHVVIVDRNNPDRSDGEGVPVAGEVGHLRVIAREGEPGLVGEVALRTVADLVLVVARARHPRTVARGTHVVVEEAAPGPHRIVADIRVAQVAVDEMEQRVECLDRVHDVTGVHRPRAEALSHRRWYRLVAEAGETEPLASAWRGAERTVHRRGATVVHRVGEVGVGWQPVQLGVVGPDRLPGQCLDVDALLRIDTRPEARTVPPEAQPRLAHPLRRRPRHRDLTGRIRAELDMQLLRGRRARDRRLAYQLGRNARTFQQRHRGGGEARHPGGAQERTAPQRRLRSGHRRFLAHADSSPLTRRHVLPAVPVRILIAVAVRGANTERR